MSDVPLPSLCFSLTAHEAVDVLADQIDNVLAMCPGSVVVLHLSRAFEASLAAVPSSALHMRRLQSNPSVILNPDRLVTKWAHMFHAHISNIALLARRRVPYDTLVLLSSGDLIVRPGLAARVAGSPCGVDAEALEGWYFTGRMLADARWRGIAEAAGAERLVHSYHEGSYYRRDLAEAMTSRLKAAIADWDYDTAYPKEEVFFPTLVRTFDGVTPGRRLGHVLGYDPPADREAVRRVLANAGLCGASVSPVLAAWSQSGASSGTDEDGPYILSRLPRRRDNLLRLLLADLSPQGASPRARHLAARLDPFDTVELDLPGATNTGAARHDYLAAALFPVAARPLLHVEAYADDHVMQVTLPPSPEGHGQAPRIDFRAGATSHWQAFCGHVPDGDTTITITKHDGHLRIDCSNPALAATAAATLDVPAREWGTFTLATAISDFGRRGRAIALRLRLPDAAARNTPHDAPHNQAPNFWAELQRPGFKNGLWPRAHLHHRDADGTLTYWSVFPAEMVERLRDDAEPGEVVGFLSLPVICGQFELLEYGVIEDPALPAAA